MNNRAARKIRAALGLPKFAPRHLSPEDRLAYRRTKRRYSKLPHTVRRQFLEDVALFRRSLTLQAS